MMRWVSLPFCRMKDPTNFYRIQLSAQAVPCFARALNSKARETLVLANAVLQLWQFGLDRVRLLPEDAVTTWHSPVVVSIALSPTLVVPRENANDCATSTVFG